MLSPHLLHSFDEEDLHTMHDAYLRLCERLGIRMTDTDDGARLRVAQVIVELAQSGTKPGDIEAVALAKLRD
jgi:hypothetical protein